MHICTQLGIPSVGTVGICLLKHDSHQSVLRQVLAYVMITDIQNGTYVG